MNWHNIKTIAFWACVCVVGILQALKGQGIGDFTVIISILGVAEHALNGNTETPVV